MHIPPFYTLVSLSGTLTRARLSSYSYASPQNASPRRRGQATWAGEHARQALFHSAITNNNNNDEARFIIQIWLRVSLYIRMRMKELERDRPPVSKSARARLLLTGPRVIIALAILKTFLWAINNSPVLSVCLFFLSALLSSPRAPGFIVDFLQYFGCAHIHDAHTYFYIQMIQGNLRHTEQKGSWEMMTAF